MDPAAVAMSLLCAASAVVISLPPGVVIAWVLARRQFRGKVIVELLVMLPMVVPPVVTGYLLLILFSRHGWIGRPLFEWLHVRVAFTWLGATVAQALIALPLLVLTLRVAIESVDRELEQAATTMGASSLRVFLRVTLPLSWHGLAAGCVLAFARALGEFGATIIIAGNIAGRTRTLPLAIFSAYNQPGNEATAMGLVLIAIALACAALIVARWLSARAIRAVTLRLQQNNSGGASKSRGSGHE